MKKGQMEIAGLVIIVILITLGMLFALLFFIQKEPMEKKIFVRKGLAYSTMGALLKTSVPCETVWFTTLPMVDLLEDCAREQQGINPQYRCREQIRFDGSQCSYVRSQITSILDSTLGAWNKNYVLKVQLFSHIGGSETSLFDQTIESSDGCPNERDSSGFFPEQTDWGIIQSQLFICD